MYTDPQPYIKSVHSKECSLKFEIERDRMLTEKYSNSTRMYGMKLWQPTVGKGKSKKLKSKKLNEKIDDI